MRESMPHPGIRLLPAAQAIQPVAHMRQVVVADEWQARLGVAGQRDEALRAVK